MGQPGRQQTLSLTFSDELLLTGRIDDLDRIRRHYSFAAAARQAYRLYTNKAQPGWRPAMAISLKPLPFGTSGPHGSALHCSFNEAHALSLSQAMCDYRARQGIYGPVFLVVETNALSTPAFATALEVLAANGVEVRITSNSEHMPLRAVSSAIRTYNRGRANGLADGIVIALLHERPEAGAFIYILPHGGFPDRHAARWIDTAANEYLRWGPSSVRRLKYEEESGAARSLPRFARDLVQLTMRPVSPLWPV